MEEQRPVYRHVIVKRRAIVERVASPEDLRRVRQQYEAGAPIDEDLKHLYVGNSLRETMKKVMGWAGHGDVPVEEGQEGFDLTGSAGALFDEADAVKQRGQERPSLQYKPQEAIIVSRVPSQQIPGGKESLPIEPMMLTHPGFDQAVSPEAQYMECAVALQKTFQEHSDRQFLLMDPEMRASVTLVTVCISPITAVPRATVGLELLCEFHQATRFGYVDTDGFEVLSETGEYPIATPTSMDLMMMMKSADEFALPASKRPR